MHLKLRICISLLIITIAAACSRQPDVLVMAATSTPQGAVVPTRAPTLTSEITATLAPTATHSPTTEPTSTDTTTPSDTATPPIESTVTLTVSTSTPTITATNDDIDGDGLSFEQEQAAGTNPEISDTDLDGLSDGEEIAEWNTNPLEIDTDGDLLSDGEETTAYGTDPTNRDTDDDQLLDGDEVQIYGTDPLSNDTDGDTLVDLLEVELGTDPTLLDTDGDGQPDGVDQSPLTNNTQTSTPTVTPIPLTDTSGLRYLNSTAFTPTFLTGAISAGDTVSGAITNEQPFVLYSLETTPGTSINITMDGAAANGSDFYPRIVVIDPKGREVARTSDYSVASRAVIEGLMLSEAGTYVIAASRVGGQFGYTYGDFELAIETAVEGQSQTGILSQPINYGNEVTGEIDDNVNEHIYTLHGREGDTITISMNTVSGDLDPRLMLTDNLGNPLVMRDDDYEALSFNSMVDGYVLPHSGYYSVVATRYESRNALEGTYSLLIELNSQLPSGEAHQIEAPLDFINSIALRTDLEYYAEFSAGDAVDDDKNEVRLDTLLTFYLPPLEETFELSAARLHLEPCLERNQGFAALGELSILEDAYGSLSDDHDFTRPAAGSSLISQTSSCSAVDLTDVVRDAYNAGQSTLQIRLTFRTPTLNGQPDSVVFTPQLILEPAE